ncbi:YfcE family phosphodiesterase [Burkholderia sp. WAC0059]|uniref:metallophosphoesterase family protein n=1 Tax=Burkholderia sp. WAC0059 TaxID=2066022 RepID=UPI000C7ECC89|nr:metallophosphoesterase family protein [Burkholderia sp. WAC0059]PLZ02590.1 YfcE family phosphodiesterase [Burkholderia sp. WAC0059]
MSQRNARRITGPGPLRIALVSDTHNLVRPELLRFVEGSDAIVHAGDVCEPAVLDALAHIAPVTAVRGNNDRGTWADALPVQTTLDAGGVRIAVVHALSDLRPDLLGPGVAVVVSGHSHRPSLDTRDGVLYVNPGSAGPRRFRLPISAALLTVGDGVPRAEQVRLVE